MAQAAHPLVAIRGTLEARAQGADLVIMSSLNEGTWPHRAKPDAWLNRPLRQQIGLSLPEQHIGLAAHDFQTAITASRSYPQSLFTHGRHAEYSSTVAIAFDQSFCRSGRGWAGGI